MPGVRFAGRMGGNTFGVNRISGLLGNSESGNATATVVGQLYDGDLLALTTNSTYTGGPAVVRQLLAADKTASYQASSVNAGIFGAALSTVSTNASGVAIQPTPLYSANIPYPYGEPGLYTPDPTTGRGIMPVAAASGNIFAARIYGGTTRSAATLQALATTSLLGIVIVIGNGTNGYPTGQAWYFIDPAPASAGVSCARFMGWNTEDPNYWTTLGASTAVGWTGSTSPIPQTPECFFQFQASFAQDLTGVSYTAQ